MKLIQFLAKLAIFDGIKNVGNAITLRNEPATNMIFFRPIWIL